MTYRIRTLAAVAATLSASLLATPSAPAHANDERHCVAIGEFYRAPAGDRRKIERMWEVTGLGRRGVKPIEIIGELPFEYVAYSYPACGYDRDEAWVLVIFQRRKIYGPQAADYWRFVRDGATLHGRP